MTRTPFFLSLLLLCAVALAQDESRRPSSEEIVRRLSPAPDGPRMRSFNPTRNIEVRGISVEGDRPKPTAPPSIDLEVNFEYDSANLTPDARIVLDNLGKALSDPALKTSRIMVAGHTDAAGSDVYNLALSKRRAQAVADYLKREHGIEITRLQIEGYGRTKLLDAANPLSGVNRRVQVANLGDRGK